MNDEFDRAWDLVKTPYHGTNARNAEKIMQEGLVPAKHKSPGFDYSASFAAHHPDDAMDYAMSRMGMRPPEWGETRGGPVVIHIPSKETSDFVVDDDGEYITYDQTIPPELLEIVYQGRNRNIGEDIRDYRAAMNAEADKWVQNWEDEVDEP